MNISLVGRHIDLSDSIKEHLMHSIDTLGKYHLDLISVNAVASMNERKKGVMIEFTINVAGKNTIVITQRDNDLYAAIDIAIDRAQKALRRLHDRLSDHRNEGMNEAKTAASGNVDLHALGEAMEDEIVPMELELYKPQEVAEVLEKLKESGKQFEVFYDNEGKMRVLFKRNDGRYGLY
ncbi:ribosome-associated translation inhibitor RaiA [Sulfuricurvum sp. IAE1]|jgi:putative sigma-54 modulation protein|uniref:ribosome hibernation-promoting factor, HPF/YfiA family n=1 Tax=Sulfuricurvum sp. IAE1 TaxID=2546102 RepID=UPI00105195F1|nr:ribosome-associated translation inhibitor RaiA [Sulfuricurvum sp. IAE1]MDD3769534.1 ribosome-associated translation inhibitor RaiA [Sulfuricurvum sp.]MDX9965380.1 ribosome-associated translation inhibitor RaiA [Sulfuricurvum sp.]TDA62794.1 ribosome-associated translation inhibitor RaiA [Sulfuricurvum sp. IAE1]